MASIHGVLAALFTQQACSNLSESWFRLILLMDYPSLHYRFGIYHHVFSNLFPPVSSIQWSVSLSSYFFCHFYPQGVDCFLTVYCVIWIVCLLTWEALYGQRESLQSFVHWCIWFINISILYTVVLNIYWINEHLTYTTSNISPLCSIFYNQCMLSFVSFVLIMLCPPFPQFCCSLFLYNILCY